MLEEAVGVIRELLTGKLITHHGTHYQADTARLYSTPQRPLPIYMSGFGEKSVKLAAGWPARTCACSPAPTSSGSTGRPAAGTAR